jgi:hypothetical protein
VPDASPEWPPAGEPLLPASAKSAFSRLFPQLLVSAALAVSARRSDFDLLIRSLAGRASAWFLSAHHGIERRTCLDEEKLTRSAERSAAAELLE